MLETDDAGLMVQSYKQVCTLRSVDAYPTTLGFDELATRLETRPPKGQHRDGCGVLRSASGGRGGLEVVVSRLEAGQFFGADDPTGLNQFCAAPTPEYDWGAVRADPTFRASDLSSERSWVTVVHDQEFLRRDLGCRGFLFCSSPVKGPVLP